MEKIVIIGAGGMAKLVVDIIESSYQGKKQIIGFLEEYPGCNLDKEICGYNVIGDLSWIINNREEKINYICAISDTKVKARILNLDYMKNLNFDILIHYSAVVSNHSMISSGVIINAGAVIASGAKLDEHTFVNFGCTIGHDVVVKKYSSIMPGVNVGGNVIIGEGSYLGINSTILQELSIGKYATVGASSLVTKDVLNNTVVIGIPAKPLKK